MNPRIGPIAFPLAAFSIIYVLSFSYTHSSTETSSAASGIIEKYRSAIVRIHFETSREVLPDGRVLVKWIRESGFIVDQHCTVLTAKHLFEGLPGFSGGEVVLPRPPYLEFPATTKGGPTTAQIAGWQAHPTQDLALVFAECDMANRTPLRLTATEDPGRPFSGEAVFMMGYSRTLEKSIEIEVPVVRRGIVAASRIEIGPAYNPPRYGKEKILLEIKAEPGFSGSAIIHQDSGNVVGVLQGPGGIHDDEGRPRTFGFQVAIPVSHTEYESMLNAHRATIQTTPPQE